MITADQLLAHLWGDYIIQSDYEATAKTKQSVACLAHVLTYAIPFLFLRPSVLALSVIISTHFVIDRWRLARHVVWIKNFIGPKRYINVAMLDGCGSDSGVHMSVWCRNLPWSECKATGYPPLTPPFLAFWLMIFADNILHITINGLALKYL
jgi:hypothetical protein